MKFRKQKMKRIIIGIFTTVVIIGAVISYLTMSEYNEYEEKGAVLIDKVEKYRARYGMLPNSVEDLHIELVMNEGPYYERVDSVKYKVYFNIGFDNTYMYYSNIKTWKYSP
ncbi:MAG: hypothetical protein PF588_02015 [Candidatus Kapabacteria bacterium]|jgi:ABC-type molybdate transport system ATPase subunit|nr:hypothetical protein [Candidatus Kapabacteria bacterium]